MKKFNEFTAVKGSLDDEKYMSMALLQAEKAKLDGNPAVGAVLVMSKLHFVDCDTTYSESDNINHAVMNVIKKASGLTNKSLSGAVIVTTLEPCLMCAMAAFEHGIREVVFGAYDNKRGFSSSKVISEQFLNEHQFLGIAYKGGILGEQCLNLLSEEMKADCHV